MKKALALATAVGAALTMLSSVAQAQAPRHHDGVRVVSSETGALPPTMSSEGLVIASLYPDDAAGHRKAFEFEGSTLETLKPVKEGGKVVAVEALYEDGEDGRLALRTWEPVKDAPELRTPLPEEATYWKVRFIDPVDDRGYLERYWDYREWGGRHSENVESYRDFCKAVRGTKPSNITEEGFDKIGALAGRDKA